MRVSQVAAWIVLIIGILLLLRLPLGLLEPFAVPVALICAGIALLWRNWRTNLSAG